MILPWRELMGVWNSQAGREKKSKAAKLGWSKLTFCFQFVKTCGTLTCKRRTSLLECRGREGAGGDSATHPRISNIHDDGAFKYETAVGTRRNRQLSPTDDREGNGLLNISAVNLHPLAFRSTLGQKKTLFPVGNKSGELTKSVRFCGVFRASRIFQDHRQKWESSRFSNDKYQQKTPLCDVTKGTISSQANDSTLSWLRPPPCVTCFHLLPMMWRVRQQ